MSLKKIPNSIIKCRKTSIFPQTKNFQLFYKNTKEEFATVNFRNMNLFKQEHYQI